MVGMRPGEFLVLGKQRDGIRTQMLNTLERTCPEKYNKNTVYASIRDRDEGTAWETGSDVAVFTTFDASKGMERDTCFVCDYLEDYWKARMAVSDDVDAVILRNKFLVAASRGKSRIVFVTAARNIAPGGHAAVVTDVFGEPVESLGVMPLSILENAGLGPSVDVCASHAFVPGSCFDFKYAEHIEEAFALLDVDVRDTDGGPIDVKATDGLMDLSPALGAWQRGAYFTRHSFVTDVRMWRMAQGAEDEVADEIMARTLRRLNGDPWHDALELTALVTDQRRYALQADHGRITDDVEAALFDRLAGRLDRDDVVQAHVAMTGLAESGDDGDARPMGFDGYVDVMHDGTPFELKFVGALTHEHALGLGLCLVMGGFDEGMLWNTRHDELWRVRVPSPERFMDAVAVALTKGECDRWRAV